MGLFTMDVSTLGGGSYRTYPFDMQGEFRDMQLHWSNSVSGQDFEAHYLELHFTIVGVDEVI